MIGQLEGDTRGLVKRALNSDHIIYFGVDCLKDHVEFPSSTAALVDNEFKISLEGSQWLESHEEAEWLLGGFEGLSLLLEEDSSLNEALELRILNIHLISECIVVSDLSESGQVDLDVFLQRLSALGLKVIVDLSRSALSDTSERVAPDQLLTHANDDGGLALSHGLRAE